jgi:hypothetical protein
MVHTLIGKVRSVSKVHQLLAPARVRQTHEREDGGDVSQLGVDVHVASGEQTMEHRPDEVQRELLPDHKTGLLEIVPEAKCKENFGT